MNLIVCTQSDDGYWYVVDDATFDQIANDPDNSHSYLCDEHGHNKQGVKGFFTQWYVTELVEMPPIKRVLHLPML